MSARDFVFGAVGLVIFGAAMYCLARVATWWQCARASRLLQPFAPLIDANLAAQRDGVLAGTYQGLNVILCVAPKTSVGSGDASSWINAFRVRVLDQPGHRDWWLTFHVTGALGQGVKRLGIGARDDGLAERIRLSGVTEEVERVSVPTDIYVTVAYDAFTRILEYTDDVTPRVVPTVANAARYLALAARLASLNATLNPPGPKPNA
jgi:hypothetical protein